MFVVSEFMENVRPKVWLAFWVRLSGLAELPELPELLGLTGLTGLAGLAGVAGLHWPGLLAAFTATVIATAKYSHRPSAKLRLAQTRATN